MKSFLYHENNKQTYFSYQQVECGDVDTDLAQTFKAAPAKMLPLLPDPYQYTVHCTAYVLYCTVRHTSNIHECPHITHIFNRIHYWREYEYVCNMEPGGDTSVTCSGVYDGAPPPLPPPSFTRPYPPIHWGKIYNNKILFFIMACLKC